MTTPCDKFEPNPFQPTKCKNCMQQHGGAAGGPPAGSATKARTGSAPVKPVPPSNPVPPKPTGSAAKPIPAKAVPNPPSRKLNRF